MAKKKEKKSKAPASAKAMAGKSFRLEVRTGGEGAIAKLFLCSGEQKKPYWTKTYTDPSAASKDAIAWTRKEARKIGVKRIVSVVDGKEKEVKP